MAACRPAIDFELDDIYPLNLIPGEPPPHDGLPVAGEPMMYRRLSSRVTSETITMRRAITATVTIHRRVVIRGSRMAEVSSRRMIEAARPGVEAAALVAIGELKRLVVFGTRIRMESTRLAPLKIPLNRGSSRRTEMVATVNDAAILAPRRKRMGVGSPRIRQTRKLQARRMIPASPDLSDVVEPEDHQDRRL